MLILEGSDCVGKTSVAKALLDLLPGWAYKHHTKPPVHPYNYFGWFLAHTGPKVIVDRLHWSEYAYGTVYRHGSQLTDHQWKYLELACLSRRATIITLIDDFTNLQKRWDVKREMFEIAPQADLLAMFAQPEEYFASHIQRYEPCTMPAMLQDEKPTLRLIEIATEEVKSCHLINELPSAALGLGWPGPGGFVILGEQLSTNIFTQREYQRFPWDEGPAADLLWQALEPTRYWEGYYTNAHSFNTCAALGECLRQLRPRVIVALGRNAINSINPKDHNCSIVSLPHPQAIRRFHSKEIPNWIQQLQTALQSFKID